MITCSSYLLTSGSPISPVSQGLVRSKTTVTKVRKTWVLPSWIAQDVLRSNMVAPKSLIGYHHLEYRGIYPARHGQCHLGSHKVSQGPRWQHLVQPERRCCRDIVSQVSLEPTRLQFIHLKRGAFTHRYETHMISDAVSIRLNFLRSLAIFSYVCSL